MDKSITVKISLASWLKKYIGFLTDAAKEAVKNGMPAENAINIVENAIDKSIVYAVEVNS